MKKIYRFLLLLLVLSIPALWGIFHPGLFVSDDGHWMVIRLSAFYSALTSGQFPVRFLPQLNQGFGYPVADFLYPLFLYIGSILHIFKIPFVLCVKLLFGLGLVLSGIGTYLWLKQLFKNGASLVGALVYVYFPYHIFDVYTRGSLGEVLALSFVPFIFYAAERKNILLVSTFLSFLILSHNTLALLFLPIIIGYFLIRKLFSIKSIVLIIVLSLGLSVFFWAPALFDRQFTVFATTKVANAFSYFISLQTIFLIGWISPVLFIRTLFIKNFWKEKLVTYFCIIGILGVFMSTSLSQIFWHNNLLIQFIQFPFRFLSFTTVSAAVLSAYCIHSLKKQMIGSIILLVLVGFSAMPYLFPHRYDSAPETSYTTNQDTTTVQNEYMPIWFHQGVLKRKDVQLIPKDVIVTVQKQKGTTATVLVEAKQSGQLSFGFAYFPGWMATIDGVNSRVFPSKENGLVSIDLPKGTHVVKLFFMDNLYRLISDSISLGALIVLIGMFLKRYGK